MSPQQRDRVCALMLRIQDCERENRLDFEDFFTDLDYAHGRLLLEAMATWRPETFDRLFGRDDPPYKLNPVFLFVGECGVQPPFQKEQNYFKAIEYLRFINTAVQLRRQQLAGTLPPMDWRPPALGLRLGLQHEDPHVRAWACSKLILNHWAEATWQSALVRLLDDPVEYVADWAWLALLGRLMAETDGGPPAPILAAATRVPPHRLPLVLGCLCFLGCKAEVLPRLAELLTLGQPEPPAVVWWCLKIFDYEAGSLAELIRPFLDHPDHHWSAMRVLALSNPALIDEIVAAACTLPSLDECHDEDQDLPLGLQRFGVVPVLRGIAPQLSREQIVALSRAAHPEYFLETFKAVGQRGQVLAPVVVQWFHATTDPVVKVNYLEILSGMGGEAAFALLSEQVGFWWGVCAEALVHFGARGIAVLGRRLGEFCDEDRCNLYLSLGNKNTRLPHELGDLVEPDLNHKDQAIRCLAARLLLQCGADGSWLHGVSQFFLDEAPALDGTQYFYHELARPLAHAAAAMLTTPDGARQPDQRVLVNAMGLAVPYAGIYQGLLQDLGKSTQDERLRAAIGKALEHLHQPASRFKNPFRVFLKKPLRLPLIFDR